MAKKETSTGKAATNPLYQGTRGAATNPLYQGTRGAAATNPLYQGTRDASAALKKGESKKTESKKK